MLDVEEEEVLKILEVADADGNGDIEYSEWVIATINKRNLLTDEKLQTAFNLFDRDGGGTISAVEISDVLGIGNKVDSKIWEEIVNEVDQDGNGEITLVEFKTMMQKMILD